VEFSCCNGHRRPLSRSYHVKETSVIVSNVPPSNVGGGGDVRVYRKGGGDRFCVYRNGGGGRKWFVERGWRNKSGGGRWDEVKKSAGRPNTLVPAAILGLNVVLKLFVRRGPSNGCVNSLNRSNKQDEESTSENQKQDTNRD
jgi:hypothetical protein